MTSGPGIGAVLRSGSYRFGASAVISAQPPSGEFVLDAVVIGGGFFGCETALELKRLGFSQILLVEREAGLLRRASFVNQARVPNGLPYPRGPRRGRRSRKSF